MIIPDTKKYIKGYLTIIVEGLNLEKFLNMSVTKGINFWDIKRLSMTEIQLKVGIKGYLSLRKVLKRTGCKVTIVNKNGLPFFITKLKKRKMLGLGFIIFILLIFVLSSFIWSVRIKGASITDTQNIEENLAELGVKPGAFKLDLSVSDIENNMLIRMKSLSWIKVRLVGTRAEVEVKERILPPEVVPQDKPCNIIAKKDGIITKIVSSKGDVIVNKGDPVRKGDILVTGILQRENADSRYVHAIADVEARTWYESSAAVPLEKLEKVRTGNICTNIYLVIGSSLIHIKNNNINYKSYDKIIKSTKLIDTDLFQLPIEIVLEEYHETTARSVTISKEEAKKEACDMVEKVIIDSMPKDAKILDRKININIKENVIVANALYETIEDIGIQEEIEDNENTGP